MSKAANLAVPVGWKLVPTRPTEAMMDGLRTGSRTDVPGNPLCQIRWAAALSKAPMHEADAISDKQAEIETLRTESAAWGRRNKIMREALLEIQRIAFFREHCALDKISNLAKSAVSDAGKVRG